MTGPGASPQIQDLDDVTFDSAVGATQVAVVAFGAPGCTDCATLCGYLETISSQLPSSVGLFHVDIEESPGVASRLGLRGVPTLIILKGGKVVERLTGLRPQGKLKGVIEAHL